jgi:hypothetical protein
MGHLLRSAGPDPWGRHRNAVVTRLRRAPFGCSTLAWSATRWLLDLSLEHTESSKATSRTPPPRGLFGPTAWGRDPVLLA